MTPLRVAVVGVGRIAQAAHLPALLQTPNTRLVALCDPRPEVLRPACATYGVPGCDTLDELLHLPEIEAVIVCVPIAEHEGTVVAALDAGKHVLAEKPLALSVAAGRRMIEAARRNGRRLMVGYHKRSDAGCRQAREWMPEIGAPSYLTYRFGTTNWLAHSTAPLFTASAAPIDSAAWAWPAAASTAEQRAFYLLLLDMFSHMTNLLRWLTGQRPVVEWVRSGELPAPGAPKPDGLVRGILALRFGEAPALLADGPHYAADRGWHERCEIWGTRSRIELEFPPNVLQGASAHARLWLAASGETKEFQADESWAFQQQAAHFARCIRTGEPFVSEGEDALVDVELAEAALA